MSLDSMRPGKLESWIILNVGAVGENPEVWLVEVRAGRLCQRTHRCCLVKLSRCVPQEPTTPGQLDVSEKSPALP